MLENMPIKIIQILNNSANFQALFHTAKIWLYLLGWKEPSIISSFYTGHEVVFYAFKKIAFMRYVLSMTGFKAKKAPQHFLFKSRPEQVSNYLVLILLRYSYSINREKIQHHFSQK